MAAIFDPLLKPSAEPRLVSPDIWSVVETTDAPNVYDSHAKLYDRLIGNALYNRIAWGTSPQSYETFAHLAVKSGDGPFLDAGCGSLVSTAQVYLKAQRQTILCDLSVGMLGAARERIISFAGKVPDHLVFLQADLKDLPFRDACFGSVLCPGMLHIFDDVETVTRELTRVVLPSGKVFMSSLVTERWISSKYLGLLHRAGEVAEPRSADRLLDRLEVAGAGFRQPVDHELEGSMMFLAGRPTGSQADGDDGKGSGT